MTSLEPLDWTGTLTALQGMIGDTVEVEIVGRREGTVAALWGGLGGDAAHLLPRADGDHDEAAKVSLGFNTGEDESRALAVGFFQLEPPPVFQGAVQTGPVLQITLPDVVIKVAVTEEVA
jgi:hypothetical protein